MSADRFDSIARAIKQEVDEKVATGASPGTQELIRALASAGSASALEVREVVWHLLGAQEIRLSRDMSIVPGVKP